MTLAEVVAEIDALCDTNSTTYTIASKTRRINSALETLVGKILVQDGTWQHDDPNYTDLPIGTFDLVDGQSKYTLDNDFLAIDNLKVIDNGGLYHILTPVDQSDSDTPLEDYLTVNGLPKYYDKNGRTIRLYPAPDSDNVTLTAGGVITFKRTAHIFSTAEVTTGTLYPGIASPWHITIAKMAALPYCKTYKKDRVPQLFADIETETKELLKFYARRQNDRRDIMTMKPILFR